MRTKSSENSQGVRTVTGSIAGGSVSGSGPGYNWIKTSTGAYTITLTEPFGRFMISAQPSFIGGVGSVVMNAVSRNQASINAYTMASAPTDANIYFVCYGRD